MELADMQDLGSCAAGRVGSSPTFRIVKKNKKIVDYWEKLLYYIIRVQKEYWMGL